MQYKPGSITMHCYFCAPFYFTLLHKVTQKLLNQKCLSFNGLTGQCCPIKCTPFTSERKKHCPTYTNAHKKMPLKFIYIFRQQGNLLHF